METLTEPPHSSAPARTKTDAFGFLARFAPLLFLIVLIGGVAIFEPRFLTPLNLFNILRQVSIYGLLAVGMTFVILTARTTTGRSERARRLDRRFLSQYRAAAMGSAFNFHPRNDRTVPSLPDI